MLAKNIVASEIDGLVSNTRNRSGSGEREVG